mmetsp:Transcript_32627/g.50647  ORF Transcript_32627/g.50647 Transcript_32627/m.50647 type:complete len:771 (+) Transcript_32627:60-2372(+)
MQMLGAEEREDRGHEPAHRQEPGRGRDSGGGGVGGSAGGGGDHNNGDGCRDGAEGRERDAPRRKLRSKVARDTRRDSCLVGNRRGHLGADLEHDVSRASRSHLRSARDGDVRRRDAGRVGHSVDVVGARRRADAKVGERHGQARIELDDNGVVGRRLDAARLLADAGTARAEQGLAGRAAGDAPAARSGAAHVREERALQGAARRSHRLGAQRDVCAALRRKVAGEPRQRHVALRRRCCARYRGRGSIKALDARGADLVVSYRALPSAPSRRGASVRGVLPARVRDVRVRDRVVLVVGGHGAAVAVDDHGRRLVGAHGAHGVAAQREVSAHRARSRLVHADGARRAGSAGRRGVERADSRVVVAPGARRARLAGRVDRRAVAGLDVLALGQVARRVRERGAALALRVSVGNSRRQRRRVARARDDDRTIGAIGADLADLAAGRANSVRARRGHRKDVRRVLHAAGDRHARRVRGDGARLLPLLCRASRIRAVGAHLRHATPLLGRARARLGCGARGADVGISGRAGVAGARSCVARRARVAVLPHDAVSRVARAIHAGGGRAGSVGRTGARHAVGCSRARAPSAILACRCRGCGASRVKGLALVAGWARGANSVRGIGARSHEVLRFRARSVGHAGRAHPNSRVVDKVCAGRAISGDVVLAKAADGVGGRRARRDCSASSLVPAVASLALQAVSSAAVMATRTLDARIVVEVVSRRLITEPQATVAPIGFCAHVVVCSDGRIRLGQCPSVVQDWGGTALQDQCRQQRASH